MSVLLRGHRPSAPDLAPWPRTPQEMHATLKYERRMACIYTHHSFDERSPVREQFEREFSHREINPLDVPNSMRAAFVEGDHVVIKARR